MLLAGQESNARPCPPGNRFTAMYIYPGKTTKGQQARHLNPSKRVSRPVDKMADFVTRLPLEVIQQIASLCAFRDVLSIGWTCRKFRRACDDPFVLQWCFLNHVSHTKIRNVRFTTI